MKTIKNYVKERPFLYDSLVKIKRGIGRKSPIYEVLDSYSKKMNRNVRFLQIGANDGLRNDPIREFIVRDDWNGIFVEPVPYAFDELKRNYSSIKERELSYVNAAIGNGDSLTFWTFRRDFLGRQCKEDRMDYLRKSSFSIDHLKKFYGHREDFDDIIESLAIPCCTLSGLLENHWTGGDLDLLVIDAEGYEKEILDEIDCIESKPKAILYESHHLTSAPEIENNLRNHGYQLLNLGGDTFAEKEI